LLVEVPAGRLEPGEAPLAAARRELEEETGHRAREWRTLASFFPAPGFCSERITLFLATGLESVESARPRDPDEEIELLRLFPREIAQGPHPDAKTRLAALTLLLEG
jgi:ADP-ribose pyrophosphatase